jgi:hypothetical protein
MDDGARRWTFELGDRMVALCGIAGFDGLSETERTAFCVYNLDVQVLNGGFPQLFSNTGWCARATLDALERVGLPQAHSLLRQALSVFPAGVEPGSQVYDLPADTLDYLSGLNSQYYQLDEDLYGRLHAYAADRPQGFRGPEAIEALVLEREESDHRRKEAIESLEREWSRQERPCPRCGTRFVSVRNRGRCPSCLHTFLASHPDNPDAYPYGGEWDLYKA